MLYIGNFSYNDDSDSKDNYCLMPCIVEADDAEQAMEKFAEHFQQIRKGSDLVDAFNDFWDEKVTDGTVLETATAYGLQGSVILG